MSKYTLRIDTLKDWMKDNKFPKPAKVQEETVKQSK